MTETLSTKTVLISGAGSGIGAAIAAKFAAASYRVILIGRRLEMLKKVCDQLPKAETPHLFFSVDLGRPEQVSELIKQLSSQKMNINTLVNNAGIFRRNDSQTANTDLWKEMFTTNIFGCADLTEKILPLMPNHAGSSVVNISSGLASRPTGQTGIYSASKAAMDCWSKSLAIELGARGIRVNVVSPGFVDTPIHDFHFLAADEKTKTLASMGSLQPLGRIGTPADVAEVAYFLAAPATEWTTGAVINVDGGINLV